LDEAIAKYTNIEAFLQQDISEKASLEESLGQLTSLFS
jgi:flagellum-specific ATP synthase